MNAVFFWPFHKKWEKDCDVEYEKNLKNHLFFNTKYNDDPVNNNYQVYPQSLEYMTKKDYQVQHDTPDYFINNVKFYKNKSEFIDTADYWINFEDKSAPFLEIDIKEKPTSHNPSYAPTSSWGLGNG